MLDLEVHMKLLLAIVGTAHLLPFADIFLGFHSITNSSSKRLGYFSTNKAESSTFALMDVTIPDDVISNL